MVGLLKQNSDNSQEKHAGALFLRTFILLVSAVIATSEIIGKTSAEITLDVGTTGSHSGYSSKALVPSSNVTISSS